MSNQVSWASVMRLAVSVGAVLGCILLSSSLVSAQHGITTVEQDGRKIFVNDDSPVTTKATGSMRTPMVRRVRYVYWSNTEHRWKPVPPPSPNILKAARSAAAEVSDFIAAQPAQTAIPESAPQPSVDPNYQQLARGRLVSNSSIDKAIEEAALRHNVDPNLVRAIVKVESNFNPTAVSRKGAMGLMQLMPATARQLRVSNPFDPAQNVDAGVRHLKGLLDSFHGDIGLSLAAYNAGEGAVQRNGGVPPYAETRNYVKRITSLYGRGDLALRLSGPIAAPIHVYRDERGVLQITNTE